MSKAISKILHAGRYLGGLLTGVAGSGTVAAWLFAAFEWLGVEVDPTNDDFGLVGWAAILAAWVAGEFAGQSLAANLARSPHIIWPVAALNAAILTGGYYFEPHPLLLVGAAIGFLVAYRLRNSDVLFITAKITESR